MSRSRRSIIGLVLAIAAGATLAGVASAAGQGTTAHDTRAAKLTNWPEFGLNPQRTNTTTDSTGITAANIGQLHLRRITLPGTVDSSPIFLHDVDVEGAAHNVAIVTTTYGITLAIDPASGQILWTFTPPGISAWAGTYQITVATPIAAPNRRFVYATSPNGLVHKLSIENGTEAAGWPARITVLPAREKLTAGLNIADGELLATTGGYIGDTPPYVGHIVAINLQSGHIDHVFNTLCANRRTIISPPTCSASDSAILSRSGPVVEAGGKRVLIATGNAPWNGTTDFGDSLIELTLPGLRLRQAYTPTDQAMLNSSDLDEGSGSPALLPGHLALIGGKDGLLRLLNLNNLDGRAKRLPSQTGGQLQLLPTPGSAELFSAPAVWNAYVFVADGGGTTTYHLSHQHLQVLWSNSTHGTSPILAGGLLWVYDMDSGGLNVYKPLSGKLVTTLSSGSGHWNSPIVVDGYVILPEGDANSHSTSGVLDIWSRAG
jgi:outer membrane protein assembly factor BamB